jgi:mRNA interferase RelE/StbE
MDLKFGKRFSKDIDSIENLPEIKKLLLKLIQKLKDAESFTEIKGTRKISGYQNYYRIRLADYRIGIKLHANKVEMVRFLHRKDIYRRFP